SARSDGNQVLFNASHAARCTARHGVRSHAVPWRSWANVPSRSCGTSHAGGGRHFCALSAPRTAEQHQSVGESHGPPRLSQPGRSSIPEVLTPRDAQAVTGRIRITATALRPFIDQPLVARRVPYLSLKSPNSHWP